MHLTTMQTMQNEHCMVLILSHHSRRLPVYDVTRQSTPSIDGGTHVFKGHSFAEFRSEVFSFLSIHPSARPSVRHLARSFVRPQRPAYQPVPPSVRPPARQSVRPSARPPGRPSIRPPARLSVRFRPHGHSRTFTRTVPPLSLCLSVSLCL